ncbi:MAG: sugar phosphate isomerase/epimerase [Oscillospiraceae bacterium]|nr:sugar phosphate isomerase/epimerase [Oscillospiraceae bacterium]
MLIDAHWGINYICGSEFADIYEDIILMVRGANPMKIGYQLYSALKKCGDAEGLKDVIRQIAEMGYDGVEFFNYAGIPAGEMKELLDSLGITAINSHVYIPRWENNADLEIGYAVALGMKWITIPYIPPEERTEETYLKLCRNIPVWSKECMNRGITLCYHNHDFEYTPYKEGLLLDRILESSDDLMLEMDTFWVKYAGFDPISEMDKRRDRLPLIHIKDYLDLSCFPPAFTEIGTGHMENGSIIRCAEDLGVEWVIVEQDNSPIDELESARISIENIRKSISGIN